VTLNFYFCVNPPVLRRKRSW